MCLRAGTQKNEEEAGDLHLKTRFHGQMSDTFHAAVFVTLSGGFQDAYTYICRGQVFANAQTGNIVLLSAALLRGESPDISQRVRRLSETSGKKFFNPDLQEVFPRRDFEMCTQVDRFPYALRVRRESQFCVEKIEIK